MDTRRSSTYLGHRPIVLGLSKILFLSLGKAPIVQAAPLFLQSIFSATEDVDPKDPHDPSLWLYLTVAAILVLLGGAFAGLTIALMGQVRASESRE
jgi:metal transporter CNNM